MLYLSCPHCGIISALGDSVLSPTRATIDRHLSHLTSLVNPLSQVPLLRGPESVRRCPFVPSPFPFVPSFPFPLALALALPILVPFPSPSPLPRQPGWSSPLHAARQTNHGPSQAGQYCFAATLPLGLSSSAASQTLRDSTSLACLSAFLCLVRLLRSTSLAPPTLSSDH